MFQNDLPESRMASCQIRYLIELESVIVDGELGSSTLENTWTERKAEHLRLYDPATWAEQAVTDYQ